MRVCCVVPRCRLLLLLLRRVRNEEIGDKNVKLRHLDEAFTSEHWIVRIFKVKPLDTTDHVSTR